MGRYCWAGLTEYVCLCVCLCLWAVAIAGLVWALYVCDVLVLTCFEFVCVCCLSPHLLCPQCH